MLTVRGMRPLLAAEIVSTTGAAMTAIALPWLVLTTTGSPARAGLVAAVEWLPMALLGIPSGAVAARLGPRRTMILCDAARVPVVAAMPLLHWLGALDLGVLLVLAFLAGAFFPAHFASQRSILPDLLGEEAGELTRANAVLQAANRLPIVLGPALGGILIAGLGAPVVLVLDALTYAVSAVTLALLVPERAPGSKPSATAATSGPASDASPGTGSCARSRWPTPASTSRCRGCSSRCPSWRHRLRPERGPGGAAAGGVGVGRAPGLAARPPPRHARLHRPDPRRPARRGRAAVARRRPGAAGRARLRHGPVGSRQSDRQRAGQHAGHARRARGTPCEDDARLHHREHHGGRGRAVPDRPAGRGLRRP